MARKPVDATAASDCCTPLDGPALGEAAAQALARDFSALADPVRLQILSLLAAAEAGEVCVCDLTEPVGKSQPTVSHHLKVLADAGFVTGDKRGRWVWYRLERARLVALQAALDTRR
jgi:ArsR family transcriptional regulator